MSYTKTKIIEASHKNSIHSNEEEDINTNDFVVQIPPFNVPKGSTIQLDGAIINEIGANNDSVIELSDENYSSLHPYISSYQKIGFMYYINHNSYNAVSCPFGVKNAFWPDTEHYANFNTSVVIPRQRIYINYYILTGYFPETSEPSGSGGPNTNNKFYQYQDWYSKGRAGIEYDNDGFFFFDDTHQLSGDAPWSNPFADQEDERFIYADNPNNIFNGIKKNRANAKKYVYINNQFTGPTDRFSMADPFIKEVEIDLTDKLLETPDEITFKINQILTSSKQNDPYNMVDVIGYREHIKNQTPGELDKNILYDTNKQTLFNFSGNTLINIPANLQTTSINLGGSKYIFGNKFYSNMFVEDWKRWKGGCQFLQTTSEDHPGVDVMGESNNGWSFGGNLQETFYRAYNDGNPGEMNRWYPTINAISWKERYSTYWSWKSPVQMTTASDGANWSFYPLLLPDGSTSIIPSTNNNRMNGTIVALFSRYCWREECEGLKQYMKIYEDNAQNASDQPNPGNLIYQYEMHESQRGQNSFILYGINRPNLIITLHGTDILEWDCGTSQSNLLLNGLPFVHEWKTYNRPNTVTDNNCCLPIGYELPDPNANIKRVADHYTAIPRGFVIPSTIQFGNEDIFLKIQSFFRLNEIYIGSKKTYEEQQLDYKNWYVDCDLGFHNDNAITAYNSHGAELISGSALYKDGNAMGYSFHLPSQWAIPRYNSNIIGLESITENATIGRQALILQLARYMDYGCKIKSREHKLYIHSRYKRGMENDWTISNSKMIERRGIYGYENEMRLSPTIEIKIDNINWQNICEKYNIPIVPIHYNGMDKNTLAIGFINFQDTFGGDGGVNTTNRDLTGFDGVSYDFNKNANDNASFRQCGRILLSTVFGFDPSATANSFLIPINTTQNNAGNFKVYPYDKPPIDNNGVPDPKPGQYTSYIQDLINNIWIGATKPNISFNISRFQLQDFHTPRLFNKKDSAETNIGIGDKVAIFNESTDLFHTMEFGQISGATARFNDINYGIIDSLTGIGIYSLKVIDENREHEYNCYLNPLTSEPINYKHSLFDVLGFNLQQLLPRYGKQQNRFTNTFYNLINNDRYLGCSFFTTNCFLNQSNQQFTSLYGVNEPDTTNNDLRGTPQYFNSYMGFQKLVLSASTDVLRSSNLPQKLQNPYYIVYSDLPNSGYITNRNNMRAIGYIFKQYKTSDYYFNYAQSYKTTLTNDINISSIRTAIYNSNGKKARNIGNNSIFFYKIEMSGSLPTEETEEEEDPELKELNEINDKIGQLQGSTKLEQYISKKDPETIKIKDAVKLIEEEEVQNPEYEKALYTVKNLVSTYLVTQIIMKHRSQLLTDIKDLVPQIISIRRGLPTVKSKKKSDVQKFYKTIANELAKKAKEYTEGYTQIMANITSRDPKRINSMISTLTRATQGKVYIPGIGLGQKVIGFPRSMTGKKGRKRNKFGIIIQPEFNQVLRDILTSGDSVKEMKRQIFDANIIDNFTIDPFIGRKGKYTMVNRQVTQEIKNKFKNKVPLTKEEFRYVEDNKEKFDKKIINKIMSPSVGEAIPEQPKTIPEQPPIQETKTETETATAEKE